MNEVFFIWAGSWDRSMEQQPPVLPLQSSAPLPKPRRWFLFFFSVVNDSKLILLLAQISSKSCELSLELLEGAGALSGSVEG